MQAEANMPLLSLSLSLALLLTEVYSCYSHLACLLPEPVSYLESTADLLTSLAHSQLDRWGTTITFLGLLVLSIHMYIMCRMFEIAVTVHLLHFPVLNSYGTFWSLYQLLRPRSPAGKVRNIIGERSEPS